MSLSGLVAKEYKNYVTGQIKQKKAEKPIGNTSKSDRDR